MKQARSSSITMPANAIAERYTQYVDARGLVTKPQTGKNCNNNRNNVWNHVMSSNECALKDMNNPYSFRTRYRFECFVNRVETVQKVPPKPQRLDPCNQKLFCCNGGNLRELRIAAFVFDGVNFKDIVTQIIVEKDSFFKIRPGVIYTTNWEHETTHAPRELRN